MEEFREEYLIMTVNEWLAELKLLTKLVNYIHKWHIAHYIRFQAKVQLHYSNYTQD